MNIKWNRKTGTLSTFILLISILFVFTHCGADFSSKKSSTFSGDVIYPTNESQTDVHMNDEVNIETEEGQLVEETVEVGIKGFEEILSTMSKVSGVPLTVGSITSVFEEVEAQLPTDNDIKSFSSANQVAMMKLAAEFCYEAVRSNTYRNNLWPSTNFGTNPSIAFNITNRAKFIEESLENFFPQLEEVDDEYVDYGSELNLMILDLINSLDNNTAATQSIVFGVCTTLMSSLELMSM